ncbi:MAG: hypothetical protein Q8Q33_09215, partial [Chlamydiota bacterium]|nr:hypothetical protein [Chlamydiota bacterium]
MRCRECVWICCLMLLMGMPAFSDVDDIQELKIVSTWTGWGSEHEALEITRKEGNFYRSGEIVPDTKITALINALNEEPKPEPTIFDFDVDHLKTVVLKAQQAYRPEMVYSDNETLDIIRRALHA